MSFPSVDFCKPCNHLTPISLKLYIKNMVCIRCKMVVKDELTKLGLKYSSVELGEAEFPERITPDQRERFRAALLRSGLELMDDKKSVLIQKIKTIIIELVHYSEEPLSINLSVYLAEKIQHDYTYLANLFSEVQGTTIEKFLISHKIERVKELLVYNELSLTEIAYKMHYSSVAHLCTQFKKVTGLTPSYFKSLKDKRRSMLEDL
jgi:YesN/AraC family two-component response regulator